MSLADLIAPARRVAVVGLAKNTGKTETLNAILRELAQRGQTVGVTSVGRDGEARDAIDNRIEKPCVRMVTGSLVATTDALLRASMASYDLLEETGVRTPLGRVLVARLHEECAVEVAGPSAARDVRTVADAMLTYGAERVLIDGAIDRRAASSPAVSDGLVVATGAVLGEGIEEVVARTRDAVDLVRLPELSDEWVRALVASRSEDLLVGVAGVEPIVLHPRFALTATARELEQLVWENPTVRHLVVRGALHEPLLRELLDGGHGRELKIVVADSTRVFISEQSSAWYRRQGLAIMVSSPINLCAVTVNPVAPCSHSFESRQLRSSLGAALAGVAVLDVRSIAS